MLLLCRAFLFALCFSYATVNVLANDNVTLESITIFRTHEWLGKPTVYFRCHGENKVYLPDVVEKDHKYNFIGYESWQPLTSLTGSKCKRCGFYEEDTVKSDDTFDEWELCPINFSSEHNGRYNHFKDKEFNVTFLCTSCYSSDAADGPAPVQVGDDESGLHLMSLLLLLFLVVISIGALFLGYKWWQKKKREEQQARFIKLFEDDEDLETELGLRD